MTFWDTVREIVGDKGAAALAGALGGLVRWLVIRAPFWPDGLITLTVGVILAAYLGPAVQPVLGEGFGLLLDWLASRVTPSVESQIGISSMLIGTGGISIAGAIIDFWGRWRKNKEDGDDA